jgi:hypothetical protein
VGKIMDMTILQRVVYLSIVIVLFTPHGIRAASTEKTWKNWIQEHITYNAQAIPLFNVQQPSDVPENPDNNFFKLERYNYELHLRPNVQFRGETLRLGVKPRLIATSKQFRDGGQEGKEVHEAEVFLNEGYLEWWMTPALPLSVERTNLQWGSGFLISPSNPFYKETGKTRPDQELRGKDFVRLAYIPNDWLSFSAIANIGDGAFEVKGSQEPFHNVYALKATFTFESASVTPVISYEENDRLRIGGYGTWTASDAVLLFFDCSFAKGSSGRYVATVADDPLNEAFQQSKDDAQTIFPQILVGGSYTFAEGTTLYLEYLYYGEGYTSAESRRYDDLVKQSANLFRYTGSDPFQQQLARLGTRNLAYANQNHLAFQRRNYVMVHGNRSDIFGKLDLNAGGVRNMDDRSFYLFTFLELKLSNRFNLFSNTIVYSTKAQTEFHTPFEYMETVGLKIFF